MHTLIINGSPRKSGGTSLLVKELTKQLQGETTIIETYNAGIAPCVDCRTCWTNAGCAVNDGMREVYRFIDAADNIVIASPIYFAELTGSLLQWASRLQAIWAAENFRHSPLLKDKPRKGGVILVGGSNGCADTALAMGKRLLRTMGAETKDFLYLSDTDKSEPFSREINEKTMADIRRLAEILNS